MSNNSGKHLAVDGIQFWATQSLYNENTTSDRNGELIPFNILQRAFTYEDSTTDSSAIQGQYLSVQLNYQSGSGQGTLSSNQVADNNNCIIVSGMVAREAGGVTPSNSIGEDVVRFEHVFITNFFRRAIGGYFIHYLWDFEDQTTDDDSGFVPADWSPSGTHAGWVNGSSAVDGSSWESGGGSVFGFACRSTGTPSSGTGPSGGMGGDNPFTLFATNGLKYIYTEASDDRAVDGQFVVRLPGINFSTLMSDTDNDLWFSGYYYAYSSDDNMDNIKLRVYIDTSDTSNHSDATLLYTLDNLSVFSGTDEKYANAKNVNDSVGGTRISLNDYRTVDADHYIYLVVDGGTGFRADFAIDYWKIEESNVVRVMYETAFSQQVAEGSNGTLIVSNSVDWVTSDLQNPRENPTINFRLHARDDDNGNPCDLYVKGTYLLM